MKPVARPISAPSDTATGYAQPEAESTALALPKVARRPSQWKRIVHIDATAERVETAPTSPAPQAHRPAASTSWQDDPAFGIWLMLVIVLVNAALLFMGGLHDRHDSTKTAEPMIQQVTRAPVLPDTHMAEQSSITLFAHPEDRERITRQTLYNSIDGEDVPAYRTDGFESVQ